MELHRLKPDSSTLHGTFSLNRPPVLHIHSGDMIEGATLDAGWGIEAPRLDGLPRQRHPLPQNQVERGHALIGPVWIEGAKSGMTLIVHVETLILGPHGFTYTGGFSHILSTGCSPRSIARQCMAQQCQAARCLH
jgi:acetamidase/formamidase